MIVKTPLYKLVTWGVSNEYFVPVTGDQISQEKVYFETSHVYKLSVIILKSIFIRQDK